MAESNVTTMSPYFSCILKVGSGQYRSHFVCGVKSTLVVRGNGFGAVLSVPTSHHCGMTTYRYIVKLTPGFIHSPTFLLLYIPSLVKLLISFLPHGQQCSNHKKYTIIYPPQKTPSWCWKIYLTRLMPDATSSTVKDSYGQLQG